MLLLADDLGKSVVHMSGVIVLLAPVYLVSDHCEDKSEEMSLLKFCLFLVLIIYSHSLVVLWRLGLEVERPC